MNKESIRYYFGASVSMFVTPLAIYAHIYVTRYFLPGSELATILAFSSAGLVGMIYYFLKYKKFVESEVEGK